MEKKEEKKLHYLLIGLGNAKTHEDSKRQWKEILEHIDQELSKAREEGRQEQAKLDRELYGMSFEEIKKKYPEDKSPLAPMESFYEGWKGLMGPMGGSPYKD